MLCVKFVRSCSNVVWSWPLDVLVLGLLGGTPVQAIVRCCLCLVLGNLFEATCDPLFVVMSVGLDCTHKGPSCSIRPALTNTRLTVGQQMSRGILGSASTYWLPVRFSQWKSFCWHQEDGPSGSPVRGSWYSELIELFRFFKSDKESIVMVIKLLIEISTMEEYNKNFHKDQFWPQRSAPAHPGGVSPVSDT